MRTMRKNWSVQLVRIYQKGMDAHQQGLTLDDCPYTNSRSNLQRQRIRYWCDGWRHAAGLSGYSCDIADIGFEPQNERAKR